MAAQRGVQGLLLAENSLATYVHCSSHVLNLCIVQACSLQPIRNHRIFLFLLISLKNLLISLKIVQKGKCFLNV